MSRSHKHVTRSTFSAETLACVATADDMFPIVFTLHEVATGTVSTSNAKLLWTNGGFAFKMSLSVDAMSLFAAIAAHTVRIPSEKNLAVHLFWLRDLLNRNVLTSLEWCDTRDMNADGHTKGSIDRDAILQLMRGHFKYQHPVKTYPSPK